MGLLGRHPEITVGISCDRRHILAGHLRDDLIVAFTQSDDLS